MLTTDQLNEIAHRAHEYYVRNRRLDMDPLISDVVHRRRGGDNEDDNLSARIRQRFNLDNQQVRDHFIEEGLLKTFDGWREAGRCVVRGARNVVRHRSDPMFLIHQTRPTVEATPSVSPFWDHEGQLDAFNWMADRNIGFTAPRYSIPPARDPEGE